jgi:HrpA-like RNA helicase
MPVLIEKGRLCFPNRDMTIKEKDNNNNTIALDFIMERIYDPYVPNKGMALNLATKMDHRIMILKAATGAGKASIGIELLYRYGDMTMKQVIQTQPTTATAMAVPAEVLGIPKYKSMLKMGETIGYATGTFIKKPIKKQSVLFSTTGYLAQILKSNLDVDIISKYSFILLDEAHMRTIDYDIVFFLMKKFIQRNLTNPNCPFLIMMSATFPINKYARYFGVDKFDIMYVPGQTFPKEEHFSEVDYDNYITTAVNKMIEIHTTERDIPEKGDIICFVFGFKAMAELTKALEVENNKLTDKFIVTPIDANAHKSGTEEYFNIFRPLKNLSVLNEEKKIYIPSRRIILATPVVEAGLTLASLRYCIESGYVNSVEYSPIYNVRVIAVKPVTQANMLQRIGRVGRKAPGVFHTLYTKKVFDNMLVDMLPDIIKDDMSQMLLQLIITETMPKTWNRTLQRLEVPDGDFNVMGIDLLDYPPVDNLMASYEKLFVLGFIDGKCRPTTMGLASTKIRESLENTRMIFEGYINGANVQDLITIASILNVSSSSLINTSKTRGPVYKPCVIFSDKPDIEELNKKMYISCDVLELLFTFYEIRDQIRDLVHTEKSTLYLQKWMFEKGLIYSAWLIVIEQRDSYISTFIGSIGLNPYKNGMGFPKFKYDLRNIIKKNIWTGVKEIRKLKSAMIEGYRLNTATWSPTLSVYINDHTHVAIKVNSSILLPLPQHDLIKQTRPHHIIAFDTALKLPPNSKTGMYEFITSTVSIIDGFVKTDFQFVIS